MIQDEVKEQNPGKEVDRQRRSDKHHRKIFPVVFGGKKFRSVSYKLHERSEMETTKHILPDHAETKNVYL